MRDWGETIAWPTRDRGWVGKVIVMSLITLLGLIPIVGAIFSTLILMGWMLTALDNLRADRLELPPAGFSYLGRGVNVGVVFLLYALVLVVILGVFFGLGIGMAAATSGGSGGSGAGSAAGSIFILLGYAVVLIGSLALAFAFPIIVLQTERGGIGAGLNVAEIVRIAQSNPSATLTAGLLTILAYILGSLGSVLCFVGVFLTAAYGYAMLAGVVRVYELQIGGAPTPGLYPPPPPPPAPA